VAPARGRYLPLGYRVAAINAVVLVATVVVTILVLSPHKLSRFETDEAITLALALVLIIAVNVLLLRRAVAPLQRLTALARRVDLSRPGDRMPGAAPTSEAGELALTFNEMLARLEAERREATGRVLAGQEAERLRIAQELHDQIGQELTAVLLGLARVQARVDDEHKDDVASVQDAVRSSLEDVRRIALELRPEALDDLGLHSALAVLCERFAQRSGLAVQQRIAEPLPPLDPSQSSWSTGLRRRR
jgi:two-component system sensor histidine kinase UhpB